MAVKVLWPSHNMFNFPLDIPNTCVLVLLMGFVYFLSPMTDFGTIQFLTVSSAVMFFFVCFFGEESFTV